MRVFRKVKTYHFPDTITNLSAQSHQNSIYQNDQKFCGIFFQASNVYI